MKLLKSLSFQLHVLVLLVSGLLWFLTYRLFDGEGEIFFFVNQHLLAQLAGFGVFGLIQRATLVVVPPLHQGVVTCFGVRLKRTLGEGNLHQLLWPLFGVWKIVPMEHFTITVAAQNRDNGGHEMAVYAIARCVPLNAYLMTQMGSMESIREQLLSKCMSVLGQYIHANERGLLRTYPHQTIWNVTDKSLSAETYGIGLELLTNRVDEVSLITRAQFDALARQGDMLTMVKKIKSDFPGLTDAQAWAMYAALVGVDPNIMTHIVNGASTVIVGGMQGGH